MTALAQCKMRRAADILVSYQFFQQHRCPSFTHTLRAAYQQSRIAAYNHDS